ncbi:Thiamine Transporter 2 [Manis pentadactyla]|nr:Thiamine Transporter 2 [Manis pentadactyla]
MVRGHKALHADGAQSAKPPTYIFPVSQAPEEASSFGCQDTGPEELVLSTRTLQRKAEGKTSCLGVSLSTGPGRTFQKVAPAPPTGPPEPQGQGQGDLQSKKEVTPPGKRAKTQENVIASAATLGTAEGAAGVPGTAD